MVFRHYKITYYLSGREWSKGPTSWFVVMILCSMKSLMIIFELPIEPEKHAQLTTWTPASFISAELKRPDPKNDLNVLNNFIHNFKSQLENHFVTFKLNSCIFGRLLVLTNWCILQFYFVTSFESWLTQVWTTSASERIPQITLTTTRLNLPSF